MARVLRILICAAAVLECAAAVAMGAYLGFREKPAAGVPCSHQAVAARSGQPDDPIVCTMRGDPYYHRRSCRYVQQSSRIAMPRSRAQLHHRPCSRCKPVR